jgi:hypothetical protein
MYGVIIQVKIDRGRDDEMRAMMDEEVVPRAGQMPGFAAGSWFQALEGDGGFAVMVFDSEETARGLAERVASQGPPGGRARVVRRAYRHLRDARPGMAGGSRRDQRTAESAQVILRDYEL